MPLLASEFVLLNCKGGCEEKNGERERRGVFAHTGTPSCISSGRGEVDGATRRRFSLATDALGVRDATYAVGTEEGFTGLALNRRFALPCTASTCGAETVLRRPWLGRKG